jgi:DNA-binding response OmpR family regulator
MAVRTSLKTFNLSSAKLMLLAGHAYEAGIYLSMLEGFGARNVVRCSTPDQAMFEMERTDFDLVIVDSRLREGDAYDFIRSVRHSQNARLMFVPILMIAGHTPREEITAARDSGSHFLIRKPISAATLLERILWIAKEHRLFIESQAYAGPDRRFRKDGPPGVERRQDDGEVQPPRTGR